MKNPRRKRRYQGKWNLYKIGEISWINNRRNHPSRKLFVDWVRKNEFKSVLEIGAGELIEAIQLKDEVDYLVTDVSKVFLAEAKKQGVKCKKSCMCFLDMPNRYDVVYMNSVIEHTPNIRKTLAAMKKHSKKFFITMFKWSYKGDKSMRSIHRDKGGGYFSTSFDIDMLLYTLKKMGKINGTYVSRIGKKEIVKYKDYHKTLDLSSSREYKHRNGMYLSIYGTWRK